jgi:hypothetical protein
MGQPGQTYRNLIIYDANIFWQVTWEKGDALRPSTYAHLLDGTHGVVHTLGTLLPGGGYKEKIQSGDVFGVLSEVAKTFTGGRVGGPNPLDESIQDKSYERVNRDTGGRILYTF